MQLDGLRIGALAVQPRMILGSRDNANQLGLHKVACKVSVLSKIKPLFTRARSRAAKGFGSGQGQIRTRPRKDPNRDPTR